jgi:hypothetical protein
MESHLVTNPRHHDQKTGERRTVIPAPRSEGMFPGWGVRF